MTGHIHVTGTMREGQDRQLLRIYEPVLRFTEGELFLPTAVETYVARCSLWAGGPERAAAPLLAAGELTLARLSELGTRCRDRPLYLRFVQQELSRREVRTWRRAVRPGLRGAARFAAVGFVARLIDLLLRLSLMLRGSVPGGLVAAAELAGRAGPSSEYAYYGRVVRDAGYTVLQYWYFYPFNDWRSSFHGVNDHEADWEMVAVYLVGESSDLRPRWVAASSHDHSGDALRRRWDDPGLSHEGRHPVVFCGAGSHSGTFAPGDYVVSVELRALRRLLDRLPWARRGTRSSAFALPFVDYARGDGAAIGAGHDRTWQAVLVDDDTPWVRGYRGLWGLDTRDSFGGERAPAGPRYERDGGARGSWVNPLGWAGLESVPPTVAEEVSAVRTRLHEIDRRQRALDEEVAAERTVARALRAEALSLGRYADTRALQGRRLQQLAQHQARLTSASTERASLDAEREAHRSFLARPVDVGPGSHLSGIELPTAVDHARHTPFLRIWAAASTPMLILGIVALLARPSPVTLSGFATLLAVLAGVEAVARGRTRLLLVGAAAVFVWVSVVAGLVVAVLRNWQLALAASLTVIAVWLLALNLRELRSPPGRRTTAAGRRHGGTART